MQSTQTNLRRRLYTKLEAVAYVKRGWAIFPLAPRMINDYCEPVRTTHEVGAVPTAHARPWTLTTVSEVDAHWEKYPDDEVAIRTGNGPTVLVLRPPVDDADKMVRADWLQRLGRPADVGSALGELHFYFQSCGLLTVTLDSRIELRATGGLVVAPPSRDALGCAYEWRNDQSDFPEVPDWLKISAFGATVITSER